MGDKFFKTKFMMWFKKGTHLSNKQICYIFLCCILCFICIDAVKVGMDLQNKGNIKTKQHNSEVNIVATSYPIASLASEYFDNEKIDVIFKDYEETFSYMATPIDIEKINKADIFLYNGDYYESWVYDLLKNNIKNKDLLVIDVSKGLKNIEINNKTNCIQFVDVATNVLKEENSDLNNSENNNKENNENEKNQDPINDNNIVEDKNKIDGIVETDKLAYEELKTIKEGTFISRVSYPNLFEKLETLKSKDNKVVWVIENTMYEFKKYTLGNYTLEKISEDGNVGTKKSNDDFYLWMNLDNAKTINHNIANNLIDKYANKEDFIRSKESEINNILNEYQSELKKINSNQPLVFVGKINFYGFLNDSKIRYYSLFNEETDENISSQTLLKLKNIIENNKMPFLFIDESNHNDYVETIKDKNNIDVVIFDSMTKYDKENMNKTYLEVLRENIDNIKLIVSNDMKKTNDNTSDISEILEKKE